MTPELPLYLFVAVLLLLTFVLTRGQNSGPAVDPDRTVEEPEALSLCPACLTSNEAEAAWCRQCGAPMKSSTGLLMPDAAINFGFVCRGAVTGRPKKLVLVFTWLLLLPALILNTLGLIALFGLGAGGLSPVIAYLIILLGLFISGSLLYQVTRNYLRMPPPPVVTPQGPGE